MKFSWEIELYTISHIEFSSMNIFGAKLFSFLMHENITSMQKNVIFVHGNIISIHEVYALIVSCMKLFGRI